MTVDHTLWASLTGFQRDLCRTIATLEAPNGLEIEAALQDDYPNLTHARVYQNLDKLSDQQLITKSSVNSRENAYTLTDHGEAHLKEATSRYIAAIRDGEET